MCFTLSRVKTTGAWNWEGDEIVYDPIIKGGRRIPDTRKTYDLDIRSFLLTEDNAIVSRELRKIIDVLPCDEQVRFRSRKKGSFDFRVQKITDHVARTIRYTSSKRDKWDKRRFDAWFYPDETIANGGGDCEDRAFLLAALLLASGISGYVVRVVLGKLYDKKKDQSRDHVWVMYRSESGRWLCLEPLLLSEESRKTSRALRRGKPQAAAVEYEYIPYFAFNDSHMWKITRNTIGTTMTDYIGRRRFWDHFDPEFATSVHNDLMDKTLGGLSDGELFYVKAYSLALDTILTYDPREHFDNGYITDGWALIDQRLNASLKAERDSLNTLATIAHSVADFYAHTSYAHFAPRTAANANQVELYTPTVVGSMVPDYGTQPFNLFDKMRFSVNEALYGNANIRSRAVAYCNGAKIISGRFAQPKDQAQGFLEKVFIEIPYAMRNAPRFNERASLPHHNEIAVDGPLEDGWKIPDKHKLYLLPKDYTTQFNLRFDAAKRHIAQVYAVWLKNRATR